MNQDNLLKAEGCFRKARITGELSGSSILKYRDSIKKFNSETGFKEFASLTVEDFEEFIIKMQDKGASNSRIANVISAVKWVIKNLQDRGEIPKTLDLEKVKKPKIGRREVNYLTECEIGQFLDCVRKDIEKRDGVRSLRFMAFVMLLFQTGARIGEVLSINIGDIDRQAKEIPIIGKGNKPRTLFLKDETIYWLDRYLSIRNDKEPALFATQNGLSRWTQTDCGRSFRRYIRKSGIQKKFTIHTLRHTFATQLLMKGAGINVVQAALGHADPITTLKYYSGAVEKVKVREMINDRHFDFIPESAVKMGGPVGMDGFEDGNLTRSFS